MESSSFMQELSLEQAPRPGQEETLIKVSELDRTELNVKLPTGYGKTFTAYAAFNLLRKQGRADRMLWIVPTDAQAGQLVDNCGDKEDGASGDYSKAGLRGLRQVVDLRAYGPMATKYSRKATHHVFVSTPQSLMQGNGQLVGRELTCDHKWMIVVDEYHHYGLTKDKQSDKVWSAAVKCLPYAFRLAMSATPNRPGDDGAFGSPDVSVSYRKAVDQRAVKPMRGHSYVYRVDAIGDDGDIVSYTTSELIAEAGSDDPAAIEKLRINRKLRWSPKYISPLVSVPLERMIQQRLVTGRQLRAIVGAMCVSHAEMVCKQVSAMFPELSVEWVGTGVDGRSKAVNDAILKRFLADERAEGALDVLVHVGMAGEGLDSRLVSEVVHLKKTSINNSILQENGRGARPLDAVSGDPVICHINFDSSSEFAAPGANGHNYVGANMELAMDELPAEAVTTESSNDAGASNDLPPLPDEPAIFIANVELEKIDSGSPEVVRMKKALAEASGNTADAAWMENPVVEDKAVSLFRRMRHEEASAFNEVSVLKQWSEAVNSALSHTTSRVAHALHGGARLDKSAAGDIKKRINTAKKRRIGPVDNANIESLKKHYGWLRDLDAVLADSGVPSWLA
jgi:superfamily II DNA or RNA helicase